MLFFINGIFIVLFAIGSGRDCRPITRYANKTASVVHDPIVTDQEYSDYLPSMCQKVLQLKSIRSIHVVVQSVFKGTYRDENQSTDQGSGILGSIGR